MDSIHVPKKRSSSAVGLAVWAPLLPAIALVVAGGFLYQERQKRAEDEVIQSMRAICENANARLDAFLDSMDRELDTLDENSSSHQYHFFDRRSDSDPFYVALNTLPTISTAVPRDEMFCVPILNDLERRAVGSSAEEVLQDLSRFEGELFSTAVRARAQWLQVQCLIKLDKRDAAIAILEKSLSAFSSSAEVDGIPLWLTSQEQIVRLSTSIGLNAVAEKHVHEVIDALEKGSVALPESSSVWHVIDFLDTIATLGLDVHIKAPWFSQWQSLRSLQKALHRLRFKNPGSYTFLVDGHLLHVRIDQSRLEGRWTTSAFDSEWTRIQESIDIHGTLSLIQELESPLGELGASTPTRVQDHVIYAIGDHSLIDAAFAPWRRAILATLISVLIIALISSYSSAQAVSRQLELASLREELVASISHELRTPLTGILLQLEMIDDSRVSKKAKEKHLARIKQGAHRLRHLVDNVLQFSRSNDQVEGRMVSLNEVLEAAKSEMQDQVEGRRIVLRPSQQDPSAKIDSEAMTQVVCGLIDNSKKYSQTEIILGTGVIGDRVRLWVEDSGPGISKSDMKTLFHPFARGKNAASLKPGVGLGLTIAKRIVEANRGSIRAEAVTEESEANPGLRIVLEFDRESPS